MTHIAECETDLLLAVGIGIGGIKEADSALIRGAEQLYGIVFVTALKRKTAQGRLRGHQTAFSKNNGFHRVLISFMK